MANTPKLHKPKKPPEPIEVGLIETAEQEKTGYDKYSQRALITHKFASAYGWNVHEIWKMCDYPLMKELLKLLEELEKDENAFLNINEAGMYKIAKRLYSTKKE